MTDDEEPILIKDGSSTSQTLFIKLKPWQLWVFVSLNVFFVLAGQAVGVLLGRFYYDQGGNCKWINALVMSAAFPILLIPYFFLPLPHDLSITSSLPSTTIVSLVYVVLGVITACDNMLYSVGLLYLSASTYSLICGMQLAFNAVFSFFINSQKITLLILNSVVALSLSAALLAMNNDSDGPSGVSHWQQIIGFLTTLGASALYSLLLSLMQLSFQKVLKKETFSVVLEMQIYTSVVATCASFVGLFTSGEWQTLHGEMESFDKGRSSYAMTLVGAAVAWQVTSVGMGGLILVVSSLFSNVVSTLSLALTPIAAVIVLHDSMNGVKVIALLLAVFGFASYICQTYLDDVKAKKICCDDTISEASC